MHAYFVTSLSERSQVLPVQTGGRTYQDYQTWIQCDSLVVLAETAEEAEMKFAAWLHAQPKEDESTKREIKRIVSAQFFPDLFTEGGPVPFDWMAVDDQTKACLDAAPDENLEQGYWVDLEQVLPREPLSAGIDDLRGEVPEDISTGLNWSPDKQFIYFLSLLTPPQSPAEQMEVSEAEGESYEEAKAAAAELRELLATYPQVADKQAAAVIRARNSVVAAWLWRRYAAAHQLGELPIRVEPWCGMLNLPPSDSSSDAGSEG